MSVQIQTFRIEIQRMLSDFWHRCEVCPKVARLLPVPN
jgi:hypothetical protein